MGGGLIQLVAVGAQNVFISSNAGKSIWKKKYTKFRNFSTESIRQTISGTPDYGQTVSCVISRNGDLMNNMILEIQLQRGTGDAYYPVEQLIERVVLSIGGQIIDTITHEWFRMYYEMFMTLEQENAYQNMTNFGSEPEGYIRKFYLPLPFWFSSQFMNSNAIPLIALQYHEVKIDITLCKRGIIPGVDESYTPKVDCWVDYVFLDSDERVQFAQDSHEYLITQLQHLQHNVQLSETSNIFRIPLNFNHPVKCLMWALTPGSDSHGQYTAMTGDQDAEILAPIESAVIQFNGTDRFEKRSGSYFTRCNPWTAATGKYLSSGIYFYGFGLDTQRYGPRGAMNFSRVDNATLIIHTKKAVVADETTPAVVDETMTLIDSDILDTAIIFGYNYNVLRIQSGMGGLMFAN
jgi:hypothetical protein